jgi:hypothetical protein
MRYAFSTWWLLSELQQHVVMVTSGEILASAHVANSTITSRGNIVLSKREKRIINIVFFFFFGKLQPPSYMKSGALPVGAHHLFVTNKSTLARQQLLLY